MYSILDRYIGRVVFYNFFIVVLVLLSLSSVIKFIDELRKLGQGAYGVFEVGVYVFLCMLKDIEIFLPMAILLGVLLGLGLLLVRNELILMEIFGFSRFRVVCSLLKIVFPIILFCILINEWIVPISERTARNYRYKMINNVSRCTHDNVWIRDGNDFVYIEKMIRNDELSGVHIYHFSDNRHLRTIRYIQSAKFTSNFWNLFNVHELFLKNDDDMCVFEKRSLHDIWLTSVTPYYLLMTVFSVYYSSSLSVFDLYRCIFLFNQFNQNGQDISYYQLRFWKKIFFPISVIVMMLTAVSCILKSLLCKLNISYQIVVGVIYGFFFIL